MFCSKVEEMVLQHLSILSMKGHELDGLQIEENLLVFTFDISLVRCAHSFDIDVNTRR